MAQNHFSLLLYHIHFSDNENTDQTDYTQGCTTNKQTEGEIFIFVYH